MVSLGGRGGRVLAEEATNAYDDLSGGAMLLAPSVSMLCERKSAIEADSVIRLLLLLLRGGNIGGKGFVVEPGESLSFDGGLLVLARRPAPAALRLSHEGLDFVGGLGGMIAEVDRECGSGPDVGDDLATSAYDATEVGRRELRWAIRIAD